MPEKTKSKEPIDSVVWKHVDELKANTYNPNVVLGAEMKLLEFSLLNTGWIQPVLVSRDGVIIDGFHRYCLSRDSKEVRARYKGKLPCVVFDLSPAEAICLTIRINRAKGTHVALRMNDCVRMLREEHDWSVDRISQEIGASTEEVELLSQHDVFKARNLKAYKYSNVWVPEKVESGS